MAEQPTEGRMVSYVFAGGIVRPGTVESVRGDVVDLLVHLDVVLDGHIVAPDERGKAMVVRTGVAFGAVDGNGKLTPETWHWPKPPVQR